MSYYWILDGHRVVPAPDVLTWGRFFENIDKRRVAVEILGDVEVSTVFLGIEHYPFKRTGEEPHGCLFETMVFGGELDGEMDRYRTWDEAERGHAEMVARVRATAEDMICGCGQPEGHDGILTTACITGDGSGGTKAPTEDPAP